LCFVLPLLLLLAFFGSQFINLDSIGWASGFSHPLTGWDHLITMLAVGIWAAQMRGQAIWMLPLTFVGVMSLGGLAGAGNLGIPSVEGVILLSCAVFSVLISRKIRFTNKINVLIVAFFAFFHGFAHGQEISASASLISYTLGFLLATLLLHGVGILVAKLAVFTAGCLLTFMFNSSALADNAAIAPALEISTANAYADFYFAGHQQHCLDAVKPANPRCELVATEITSAALFKDLQILHAQPDLNVGCQADYIAENHLDFKHCFPVINHTPGKHYLSNGVGLTSPPVAFMTVLAPLVNPDFRKTSIPAIEDNALQMRFAKFNFGNYKIHIHSGLQRNFTRLPKIQPFRLNT
jgi:urease accessory protein